MTRKLSLPMPRLDAYRGTWRSPSLMPRVVSEPVQLVDLFPTVIGLTDTPSPPANDGNDLASLLSGKSTEGLAAFAVIGDQRMIVRGKSKLIWDLRQETSRLFDLERDTARGGWKPSRAVGNAGSQVGGRISRGCGEPGAPLLCGHPEALCAAGSDYQRSHRTGAERAVAQPW